MKLNKEDKELIKKAENVIKKALPVKLKGTGHVGSALITSKGNIYEGVNVGFQCGIDSCAEYQAVGTMISNGEKIIKKITAVHYDKKKKKYEVIPPCGKCREMLHQSGKKNWNTEVIITKSKKVKLKKLLPIPWKGTIEK